MHKIIPSNKKDERGGKRKIASTFLLLHGTGRNEEDLIPIALNISSETTIINPRGKLLDWDCSSVLL
jgi:predicted esterase